jgi:SWI/SNF-related matrix-associated actin-dependent regulator 1 of chromatin subfamily A
MRIDGSVSQQQRADNVEKFQNDPEILVALLSITAAGVGITLTAASTVIFAELHWTPALMIQA